MKLATFRGLPDIEPSKENIGFVLAAGIKGPKGNPTETDYLHILTPGSKDGKREHHPEFAAYNRADGSQRRFFHAQIAYYREEEFWDAGYYAQKGLLSHPGCEANPKHQGPFCHGNGKHAERWRLTDLETGEKLGTEAKPGAYVTIPCPGEACPFRQEFDTGRKFKGDPVMVTYCSRGMRIYFKPRWRSEDEAKWPIYTGKLKTYSRRAVNSWAGMMHRVYHEPLGEMCRRTCKTETCPGGLVQQLGIKRFAWIGMPFVITVGERKTSRGRATDILFTEDTDLLGWLQAQQERMELLGANPQQGLLGASSGREQSPAELALDHRTIVATPTLVKPAAVAEPDVIEAEEIPAAPPESKGEEQPEAEAGLAIGEMIDIRMKEILGKDKMPKGMGGKIAAALRASDPPHLGAGERWWDLTEGDWPAIEAVLVAEFGAKS